MTSSIFKAYDIRGLVEDELTADFAFATGVACARFLKEERVYLDRWFEKSWTDLGRALGGEGPGPYTWWSWRGKGFDTDGGWRIDYVIATSKLAERAQSAVVGKAATYAERWSDHAPLTIDFM